MLQVKENNLVDEQHWNMGRGKTRKGKKRRREATWHTAAVNTISTAFTGSEVNIPVHF